MSEGGLVNDAEQAGMKRNVQEVAQQGLGAQQQALARTSQALSTASPVAAGAITQGAQALGATAADMNVKASGQAATMAEAVRAKRAGAIMGANERQVQRSRENAQFMVESSLRAAEAVGEIIPM